MKDLKAIILAAGKGTRMNSEIPKALHKIFDKTLLEWVIIGADGVGAEEKIVVIGHKAQEVMDYIGGSVKYALQEKQMGTGHAVMQSEPLLDNTDGYTFVLYGDQPLTKAETLIDTLKYHIDNGLACTIITAEIDDPTGYGRIVRDSNNNVRRIVEQKDATEEQRKIKEFNTGIYCFTTKLLFEALKEVKNDNSQHEYYLTDTIEILLNNGHKVGAYKADDHKEFSGINSRQQLAESYAIMRDRILDKHMTNGVTIIDPSATYIYPDVTIGMDTVIYPNTIIEGKSEIGKNCIIGPNTRIINSKVCENSQISFSVVENVNIKENSIIGPFEHLK